MDFVIDVLVRVFRKSVEEATTIMMNIHNKGKELCGTYTYEIATTKVAQVKKYGKRKRLSFKSYNGRRIKNDK
jgi:ATP-dependent Clp protease adaptor protein ClpS